MTCPRHELAGVGGDLVVVPAIADFILDLIVNGFLFLAGALSVLLSCMRACPCVCGKQYKILQDTG